MLYHGYKLGWTILDGIFPPRCGGCGSWGTRWCVTCQEKVQLITGELCSLCGAPLFDHQFQKCFRCRAAGTVFDAVRSWAAFEGPVQKAVHRLKYQRDFGLAERLSRELIKMIEIWRPDFQLVTAVPLDRKRLQERGFNQALLLARPIAWAFKIPLQPRALKRVRATVSQVGLSRSERRINVRNAFCADGKFVGGCAVLIVDDVMTTGATMNASSQALKKAGAEKVFGVTLARSMLG